MAKKKLIVKGRTVEEAIQKGLKQIGLPQSKTIIRILTSESFGIFQKKDAVIAIIFDDIESQEALLERISDELESKHSIIWLEGTVQFRSTPLLFNEQILKNEEERYAFIHKWLTQKKITPIIEESLRAIVKDPKSQDQYTTIRELETIPLNDELGSIYIEVSDDKMLATAVIFFGGEIKEDMVFSALNKKGIIQGVLAQTISTVLEKKYSGFFPIAKGKKAKANEPGELQIYFQEDEFSSTVQAIETASVDTRKVKDINMVERNELLIELGEPIEGHDGYLVDGTVLSRAEMTREIQLGKNVYYSDSGREIYSKQAGHILWRPDDFYIDVEDLYIVEGNVDFSQGNVTGFVGKVIVKGDVRPKFTVTAEGDIEIHGSVEDATIESTKGSVYVYGTVVNKTEGYVQAKLDIHVAIAINAVLKGRQIHIDKEAMNSTLQAQEEIRVEGKPGALVGGVARAKKFVRAQKIGSENWIKTEVFVGDATQLQRFLSNVNQRLSKQRADLEDLRNSLKMLKLREENGSLTESQQEQISSYENNIKELEEDIEIDIEEEKRVRTEIEERKTARLEVIDTLYPQVDIHIFKGYFLPNENQKHTGFQCKNGLVVPYTI